MAKKLSQGEVPAKWLSQLSGQVDRSIRGNGLVPNKLLKKMNRYMADPKVQQVQARLVEARMNNIDRRDSVHGR